MISRISVLPRLRRLARASLLAAALCAGLGAPPAARAAITIVGSTPTLRGDDANGDTIYSSLAVQAGDYVVLATSTNKSTTTNLLSFSWSGTEGVQGTATSMSANQTFAAYLNYVSVLQSGTYTFTLDSNNTDITANTALYLLRPGVGETISVFDTSIQTSTSASGAMLDYSFGQILPAGSSIAIEAATTQSGGPFSIPDLDYTQAFSGGTTAARLLVHSTAVQGSLWDAVHPYTASSDDVAALGAVFTASAVPEPSTSLLLLSGCVCTFLRRKRPVTPQPSAA